MTRAILFDVDGTLLDTVDLHARAWQEAFRHYGREVEFGAVRQQIGKGADQMLPLFFSAEELGSFERQLVAFRRDLFQTEYLPQVRRFPGVRELYVRLRGDGIGIVLASSASSEEIESYKPVLLFDEFVDAATSSDDAKRSKPYPDIFQAALAKAGVGAAEAVAVGDTIYDAQAAVRAGLRVVGVLCGGVTEAELREAGCAAVYRDPADLLAHYEDWVSLV